MVYEKPQLSLWEKASLIALIARTCKTLPEAFLCTVADD